MITLVLSFLALTAGLVAGLVLAYFLFVRMDFYQEVVVPIGKIIKRWWQADKERRIYRAGEGVIEEMNEAADFYVDLHKEMLDRLDQAGRRRSGSSSGANKGESAKMK